MLGRIYTPNPISNHWLNDGLACWYMGLPGIDGGNQVYDLLQKCSPGVLQTSSGNIWGAGTSLCVDAATGITFPDVNNSADQNNYVNVSLNGQIADNANFSFEAFAYLRTAVGGTQELFILSDSGGTNSMLMRYTASTTLSIANTGGGTYASYTFTPDAWCHLVGVVNKIANTSTIYANGVQVGSGSGTPTSLTPAILRLLRTAYPGYPEPPTQGTRVVYFKVWNGPISSTAALALYPEFLSGFPNTLRRESTRSSVLFLGGSVAPVDNYFYFNEF